jgi:O-succinylbenzoic acid--CoA ligase
MPLGSAWPGLVEAVWGAGAALMPVDHRLPPPARDRLLAAARPTVRVDPTGWHRLAQGSPVDDAVTLVVATSGTSGAQKLALFTRQAVEAAVLASAQALGAARDDGWLACLPPAHIGGLLVVLRASILGAPLVCLPAFDAAQVAAATSSRFTSLVPLMLRRLLDAEARLGHLRAILVGAGGMDAGLRERAGAAGVTAVQTYGLTESCGGVVYDGLPLPGIRLRIDPETSAIELAGPTLMLEYRFDERATAAAFTPDGWLRTADGGRLERDGRLHPLGRLDERIDTGGERVWPDEVEGALRGHPRIVEVAVVGRPDREWGERVVAFVVPTDPADPPSLDEIRGHVSLSLPRYMAPRQLVLRRGPLPRSASGKVRRGDLA